MLQKPCCSFSSSGMPYGLKLDSDIDGCGNTKILYVIHILKGYNDITGLK